MENWQKQALNRMVMEETEPALARPSAEELDWHGCFPSECEHDVGGAPMDAADMDGKFAPPSCYIYTAIRLERQA